MFPKLNSYLRPFRMKAGLSQKDISFLLSIQSGSTISKVEKGSRKPSLPILLGYCILFEAYPFDLVPGTLVDIEKAVLNRAEILVGKLKKKDWTPVLERRIEFLSNFCAKRNSMHAKEV